MKESLSPGPDGIAAVFVRNLWSVLASPLMVLFNASLSEGVFPAEWKRTYITPVFKKGDRDKVVNYRQIAKLSIFAKVFDKLVARKIQGYFMKFMIGEQCGFLPRRSTVSNLLSFKEYVLSAFAAGQQVDCIYTDLRAAFDSVNFDLLCLKLERYGVCPTLLSWFGTYLRGRELMVQYKNYVSYSYFPSSGVPQGSNCGPLAFVIYVNDLISNVTFASACCMRMI